MYTPIKSTRMSRKEMETERLQKETEREKVDQNALLNMDEQKHAQQAQSMANTQKTIYSLCDVIDCNYKAMLNAGREMQKNQKEINKLEEEQTLKTENMNIKNVKKTNNKAIHEEIAVLKAKEENIMNNFKTAYANFIMAFNNIVVAREKFIMQFGEDILHTLSQVIIYVGNLVCFHAEVFPFKRDPEGFVTVLQPVESQGAAGVIKLTQHNEMKILDTMFQKLNNVSTGKTMHQIEEHHIKPTVAGSPNTITSHGANSFGATDIPSDNSDDTTDAIW